MQRLLSLKLLSKNLSTKTSSISSSKTFLSFPKTANSSQPHHQFFSQHTTWTCKPQKGGLSVEFPNGFFSNPLLVKQILQSTTLKGPQNRGLYDSTVGFLRVQFSRRNYHSNFSFDSNRRGGQFGFQRLTTDGLVLGLILANVAVFMLWHIMDREFMKKNFMISLDNLKSGRVHTILTHAFSHQEAMHIVFNMFGLYFFGTSIGRLFGPEYLLKLYIAGAVAGSVFFLLEQAFMSLSSKRKQMPGSDPSKAYALGASGALNAVMLLDIFLFPRKTILVDFFIPVPAVLFGIFLIAKDVLRVLERDSQVSGSGHLGGAAVGAIAWLQIKRGRFRF